jgi:hypothetical protein
MAAVDARVNAVSYGNTASSTNTPLLNTPHTAEDRINTYRKQTSQDHLIVSNRTPSQERQLVNYQD